MNKFELLQKITEKKEFSQLPKKDVELAFSHFEKREVGDEEKIKLTRELLHKVFGAFTSQKLLSPKNKNEEWILRKHLSTRERLDYYPELYKKLLANYKNKKISIVDLGAGVNGFSYKYFLKNTTYLGIEAVGQLVNLMNFYFKKSPRDDSSKDDSPRDDSGEPPAVPSGEPKKLNAKAIHESLFELEKIKKIITEAKKPKIIFLFKVLDSLEMLERDYSKKLLLGIVSLVDRVVVSFATRSMIRKKEFKAKRNWILDFIRENFKILDDFEIGGERYICFEKRD